MKLLKETLFVLLILFGVYLLICLFLPSTIEFQRSRIIKADRAVVFGLVNEIKKWDMWSPWNKMDPDWQMEYFGPESGKGAGYIWESDKMSLGSGSLHITESYPVDSIIFKLYMHGKDTSEAVFSFAEADSGVNVVWKMRAKVNFLSRLFPGLFMEKVAGKHFEQGLQQLDSLSKTKSAMPVAGIAGISSFKIEKALSVLDSCPEKDLSFKIAKSYERIQNEMGSDIQLTGAPVCIYHSMSPDMVVFEALLPVNRLAPKYSDKGIRESKIDEKKVLVYNYYGSYSDIRDGYSKIASYIEEKKLRQTGKSIEEYVSDPLVETNPDKWLTKIYIPVE